VTATVTKKKGFYGTATLSLASMVDCSVLREHCSVVVVADVVRSHWLWLPPTATSTATATRTASRRIMFELSLVSINNKSMSVFVETLMLCVLAFWLGAKIIFPEKMRMKSLKNCFFPVKFHRRF
jgi:hypothetical protein